jgi:hypothetical protein
MDAVAMSLRDVVDVSGHDTVGDQADIRPPVGLQRGVFRATTISI